MSKTSTTSATSAKITGTNPKSGTAKKKPSQNNNMLLIGGLVVLVIIAAVVFLLQRNSSASASLPDEVSSQQANELFKQGAFLLDVRTPEEWNEYHVEGTTLIPLDQLAQRVNEVPKDRQVVVVCRSGNRSQQGRDILRSAGYQQVTSMAGGLKAWSAAGYPTVTGP